MLTELVSDMSSISEKEEDQKEVLNNPVVKTNITKPLSEVRFETPKTSLNDDIPTSFEADNNCECPTPMKKIHIQEILKLRELYIEFHRENPGFFYETVYTDNSDEALKKLINLVKDICLNIPNATPYFELDKDEIYQEIVEEKIKNFKSQLENSMKNNIQQTVTICEKKIKKTKFEIK